MDAGLVQLLERAFHPRAIAVVGASNNPMSFGYHFLRHLTRYGFAGNIYPVNPGEESVQGFPAYHRLSDIPGPIDYVVCCIPAQLIPDLLRECRTRDVRVAHLFTGRLTETGRAQAHELEAEILCQARIHDVRLIGPNCMGLYHPGQGISFGYDLPIEPGPVGGLFQSGGASGEFVRYGALRGLRFSKVISYGNALDLDESDFLDYLSQDTNTTVIAAYIEGVKEGRRFLRSLKNAASTKPVVALKGGKGGAGAARACFSHTASLTGSSEVWETAVRQAGAVPAETLEDLIDLVVAFRFLPPTTGKRVGVVGGGGGKSVLSADECESAGLELPPLPQKAREELKAIAPDLWDWLGNPADRSIMQGAPIDTGKILKVMAPLPEFDFIIANITEDAPFGQEGMTRLLQTEADDFIEVWRKRTKPLAVVLGAGELGGQELQDWRWRLLAEQRQRLVAAGIPVYASVTRAARSLSRLVDYYRRRAALSRTDRALAGW
ncbi:MAG: CoA-binding protein [Chloroflexota bacterium]